MIQNKIRNVAIIAHVDHGKTTLVDQLFQQSGMFRANQRVDERLMDSLDLERERGITIAAKNGAFQYRDYWINIIDTPGHADFGGQVERVLKMADGVLLLVDAQEGPMPQTYFVLKKALALALPVIVVINKIDKPAARCDWVLNEVFDLFVRLHAPEHILDFPVVYASSIEGRATLDPEQPGTDMQVLCEMIVERTPAPSGNADEPLQMLVSSLDYSPYLGRLAIGKIERGRLRVNQDIAVVAPQTEPRPARVSKIYRFHGNEKVAVEEAIAGEIVAIAGMDEATVGMTYADPLQPEPLPPTEIDPPTLSMNFIANDSPFAGREGEFVTSRHLEQRLRREVLSDAALHVEPLDEANGFRVSGRGELHLSILIERMRREGYEFQVTRPQVIMREEKGCKLEPYEQLTIDVDEQYSGSVIEKLGGRKGRMLTMESGDGMVRLVYRIPTRGLLGFRTEFFTDTKGMGVMNYVFADYGQYCGEMRRRKTGVMVAMENCTTVGYALNNLQDRARLFYGPGVPVYRGQIVGEHCRENDLAVNPAKGKKLTNVRASGTDDAINLTPPVQMSLEDCIDFIEDDELVEVTPKAIRLRKRNLKFKF